MDLPKKKIRKIEVGAPANAATFNAPLEDADSNFEEVVEAVNDLESRVVAAENGIVDVVDDLEKKITDAENEISTVQKDIKNNLAETTNNDTEIAQIQKELDNAQSALKKVIKPHIVPTYLYPFIEGVDGDAQEYKLLNDNGNGYKIDSYGRKRFYTRIKGRKPILDPGIGCDLGMRREMFDSLQLLDDEKGPRDENVYAVDGRDWLRIIGDNVLMIYHQRGNWIRLNFGGGPGPELEVIVQYKTFNILTANSKKGAEGIEFPLRQSDSISCFSNASWAGQTPLRVRANNDNNDPKIFTEMSLVSVDLSRAVSGIKTLNIRFYNSNHYSHGIELHGIELGPNSDKLIQYEQTVIADGKKVDIPYASDIGYWPDTTSEGYGQAGKDGEYDIGLDGWTRPYIQVQKEVTDHTSTAAFQLDNSETVLLLPLERDLKDRSGKGHLVNNCLGVEFTSRYSPWGGEVMKAAYFNRGAYLRIPNHSDFLFNGLDFCIHGYVDHGYRHHNNLLGVWQSEGNQCSWYVTITDEGVLQFHYSLDGKTANGYIEHHDRETLSKPHDSTARHFAVTRDVSGTVRIFLDGIVGTNTLTGVGSLFDSSADLSIGALDLETNTDPHAFSGFLFDLVIIKGSDNGWTDTFTPPVSRLNSVLLPNDHVRNTTDGKIYLAKDIPNGFSESGASGVTWEEVASIADVTTLADAEMEYQTSGLMAQSYYESVKNRYYRIISTDGTYSGSTFEQFLEKPKNGARVLRFSHPDINNGLPVFATNWLPKYAQSSENKNIQHGDPTNCRPEFAITWNGGFSPDYYGLHQNEEHCINIHWREFGNGDENGATETGFDSVSSATTGSKAFTLDDGLTTLISSIGSLNDDDGRLNLKNDNDCWTHTFIGSGISARRYVGHDVGYRESLSLSNLPYGTHVLRVVENGKAYIDNVHLETNIRDWRLAGFDYYQPSPPPIPEGSVILADYMLMADYIPNRCVDSKAICKGVRRLHATRDVWHDQSDKDGPYWQLGNIDPDMIGGTCMVSGNATKEAWYELPFRGHGITIRWADSNTDTADYVLYLNGQLLTSAHFPNVTVVSLWGSFNSTTGVWSSNGTKFGAGLVVKGLDYGNHIIKAKASTAEGTYIRVSAFDIHTPIHRSNHYSKLACNPYWDELVGGGDNIDKDDLVVSALGERWGDVCRPDKTDIKPGWFIGLTRGHLYKSQTVLYDFVRGRSKGCQAKVKGCVYIPATGEVLIKESGNYSISVNNLTVGNSVNRGHLDLMLNGNLIIPSYIYNEKRYGEHTSFHINVPVPLKKGDKISVSLGYSGAGLYGTHFYYANFSGIKLD